MEIKTKQKKGIPLSQAFGAVLILILLGVLIVVAAIIFTSINTALPDISGTTLNEFVNLTTTGSILVNSTSSCGFDNAAITIVKNGSTTIPAGNYTLNATTFTITNATALAYTNALANYTYTYNGAACVAANATIAQFANYPALVGLVGTIIFLGIVIGVLVGSFVFRGTKTA